MNPFTIVQGARVRAKEVSIGMGTVLDERVSITGFHGEEAERVIIGDHVYLGPDVNIACSIIEIGDFATLHRRTGIFGEGPCAIGHNAWIGQDCILNSHGGLWVGNNVGIGAANHIWTHAAFGELLVGCQLFHAQPVVIEDDAWICGGHSTVNPGVTLTEKTVLLPQSLLNHNTLPNTYYGGNPARIITKLGTPYRDLSLEEKKGLLKTFIEEFLLSHPDLGYTLTDGKIRLWKDHDRQTVGVFDWIGRTYEKKQTPEEIGFLKFLRGNKARFVPEGRPRVGEEIRKRTREGMEALPPGLATGEEGSGERR
jgi:acetyltransferase-like isoleucine patch superfamily enzyme